MSYEVQSVVKKVKMGDRNITYKIKDTTNNEEFEVVLRKFFIFDNKPEKEDIIRNEYKDLNFSDKLYETTIGPGKMLYANNIPDELQNDEFYVLLIDKCATAVDFIEKEKLTYDMCFLAVSIDPIVFKHVPNKFKDDKLIRKALIGNGINLQYISKEERLNKEYCDLAFSSNTNSIRYIPLEYITYEMCAQAVINDMYCLKYIPKNWLLPVYKEAVVERNLTVPQFDGIRKHYNEAAKFKDIVAELKRLLQRETSIQYGFMDPNLTLEEIEMRVNYIKSITEKKGTVEEIEPKKK
jgi:hypothetical protein